VNVSKKEESWFIPAFEVGKSKLVSDYSDEKRWVFNDNVYSTNRYIQDNSKFMS
jgi:hypothetical protein